MRQRAVRVIAWCIRAWPRVKRAVVRIAAFIGGALILHHEVYEVQHPEPLLIFLGLWGVGVAPAQFFDGLKRLGQEAKSATDLMTEDAPTKPESKSGNKD